MFCDLIDVCVLFKIDDVDVGNKILLKILVVSNKFRLLMFIWFFLIEDLGCIWCEDGIEFKKLKKLLLILEVEFNWRDLDGVFIGLIEMLFFILVMWLIDGVVVIVCWFIGKKCKRFCKCILILVFIELKGMFEIWGNMFECVVFGERVEEGFNLVE